MIVEDLQGGQSPHRLEEDPLPHHLADSERLNPLRIQE